MGKEKSLLQKLREFQLEVKDIEIIKSTEGYGYNYATLPDILNIITPYLIQHGIWYHHRTTKDKEKGNTVVETFVYNIDNEDEREYCETLIDESTKLGSMNTFMVIGSAITYFRRYHLTTLLGLTTDEDTDAAGKKVTKKAGGIGRSVEAATALPNKPDFVKTFKNLAKSKSRAQFVKTFNSYKTQINDKDIEKIETILKETYDSK